MTDKLEAVKGIEKRMYGSVIALMAIFAAVFTLVNVNIQAAGADFVHVLVSNLATVGSFSALVGLITVVLRPKERWALILPWVIAAVAFIAGIVIAAVL